MRTDFMCLEQERGLARQDTGSGGGRGVRTREVMAKADPEAEIVTRCVTSENRRGPGVFHHPDAVSVPGKIKGNEMMERDLPNAPSPNCGKRPGHFYSS